MMLKSCLILATLSAIMVHGSSEAQQRTWRVQSFTQSMDQKGSATGDYTYGGLKVWTIDQNQPEIRFGCSDRYGLTANITFLPASQVNPNKGQRIKLRQMTTNMTIEGRAAERVPWTVVKETRTVQTRSSKHAAMIYNAVIQGLPITIKEPYKKTMTLTPAAVDSDFIYFAENCAVTGG
ncbi:MAG: hypothetical protein AAF269_03970 [Pseudomonadota bacterium]